MIFVSKSPEHRIYIRREVRSFGVNTHGQQDSVEMQPLLYVQFYPKGLDGPQRVRADMKFRELNPENPYGAQASSQGGIMGSQFNEEEIAPNQPEAFVGFNPMHMLGKFDTATDIDASGQPESPEEVRKIVEDELLRILAARIDDAFILLDTVGVEKPWPNYPLEGQGRHAKIGAIVKEMGIDPRVVIAFESAQEKPGDGVIKTMEALMAEQAAAQAEEDSLSVTVPR